MFIKVENEDSGEIMFPFDVCLNAIDKVFREKIRRGAKDLVRLK